MIKFRGKFKAMLREKIASGHIQLPPSIRAESLELLLRELPQIEWNVKIHSSYPSGAGVATYLARYIKGGPIGNSRLLSLENCQVTFKYRLGTFEGGDGKEQGVTQLDMRSFMRRVLEHVPPRRLQTVRGYGLYSGNQHSKTATIFGNCFGAYNFARSSSRCQQRSRGDARSPYVANIEPTQWMAPVAFVHR